MSVKSRVFGNAKKPEGLIGKMMAGGMNGGAHMRLAEWGMSHFDIEGDVLDIGCGGGGRFAVTNESTGTDDASVKYAAIIEGMNLYTPEDLKNLMENAGFSDIEMYRHDSKPWICVVGHKD